MTYVEVALAKVFGGGKVFSYETEQSINIGDIVEVPFGKKNALGSVISIVKKPTFATKPVGIIYNYRLPAQSIDLLKWMLLYYPDDIGVVTQMFIPQSIKTKTHLKLVPPTASQILPLPKPTDEQQKAITLISNPKNKRVLIHGDTASGKTRVFIDKAIKVLDTGKSVLILTPEIGLTPQLVDDLKRHVLAPIILTHSQLSTSKRRQIWLHTIANTTPSIFVGPRSALFLPINNLGLIVIDESHDSSYKQNQSPRYNSLHIAAKLAQLHNASLIQSSATPNVDDYFIAQAHGYKIIRIMQKAAGQIATKTQIVDITNRQQFDKNAYLSNTLIDNIKATLDSAQQVMLFLNRRGSARLIQCLNCGWQALCPKCGIPVTYHQDLHSIKCHSCNYKKSAPSNCPKCGSTDLNYKSIGTKALANHVQNLFPQARIMRFDADSESPDQFYKHIDTLKSGEIDIIIGTQLITKGIDLERLSLVGIINADSGLNMPDFRAEETTFQQLYQVTGRAGRGRIASRAIIQTRLPEHPVIQAVLKQSWEEFYKYEANKRKLYNYPPHCYLAIFKIHKRTDRGAEIATQKVYKLLSGMAGIRLLGPSPSYYEKLNNNYYWQIIAKSSKRSLLVNAARQLPGDWTVDIDPTSLL